MYFVQGHRGCQKTRDFGAAEERPSLKQTFRLATGYRSRHIQWCVVMAEEMDSKASRKGDFTL
ncbi:MAG: hypothetical protein AB1798_18485, partial [Spirochaetota bacterium]